MFRSIERSWQIAKQSWALLMQDRELLLFPLVSALAVMFVGVSLAIPGFFLRSVGGIQMAVPVFAFLFYFVNSFIVIFFNAALVGAVNIRMNGGNPTLGDGLRCAMERLGPILGYAAIAATVGMILRSARERGGILGRMIAFLGGLSWALATYVVVPVLVVEGVGPIEAIKRSAALVRRTWGHQVAGHVGFGVLGFLATVAVLAATAPFVLISVQAGLWPLAIALGAIGVVVLVGVNLTLAALTTIYQAAVHRYATTGESTTFDAELLQAPAT